MVIWASRDAPSRQLVQRGELSLERLENYRKLLAELRFLERKINPEVARQDKRKWKKIHKAMRNRPDRILKIPILKLHAL